MMPHPWHIHGNHFYVQTINGSAPPANMLGKKDVVTVPPQGGNVKLIMKYADFADATMPYMYHCHISSHEDNGMMGQFYVLPKGNNPEGINDIFEGTISYYPNPVTNELKLETKDNTINSVKIFNTTGQIIFSQNINSNKVNINTETYPVGSYYLKLEINKQIKTIQFTKK
jgi:bilirubin oxidase